MMLQIKTIECNYKDEFDKEVNEFIASIMDNEPKISFSPRNYPGTYIAYITYNKVVEDITDEA
jgi:hypothetical protein